MSRKYNFLFLIIVLITTSCNKLKKNWEYAKSINTIESYQEFLHEHNKKIYTDSAYLKIEELYFKRADSVNTITAYNEFLDYHTYYLGSYSDSAKFKIEEIHFKHARSLNTFQAYEDFLSEYPQTSFNEEVQSCLNKLYLGRESILRDTRKIKIIVNVSDSRGGTYYSLLDLYAKQISGYAGLEVVKEDNEEDYDVTLLVKTIIWVKKNLYSQFGLPWGGKNYYTEGGLSGEFIIKSKNGYYFKEDFKYYQSPLKRVSDEYLEPDQIIFDMHKNSSFKYILMKKMSEIYGKHILISAMNDYYINDAALEIIKNTKDKSLIEPIIASLDIESSDRRTQVRILLIEMGQLAVKPLISALGNGFSEIRGEAAFILGVIKDTCAVEPLILLLNDKDCRVQIKAIEALGKIKDNRAIEPLTHVLNNYMDCKEDIYEAVTDALKKITRIEEELDTEVVVE